MFIIPRLIGVSTYSLVLIIMCFFIRRMNYRDIKIMFGVYSLSLAVMGFFYVPYKTADLSRLIPIMHIYTNMPQDQFWNSVFKSSTPLVPIYYRLIGMLGVDGLLPAITALIAFFLCFSVMYKNALRINSYGISISAALFVFMSRGVFYQTISDIRAGLALAIISFAIYEDKVEQKRKITILPLLLIAAFLHVTGQFVFVYWIIYLFFEPNKRSKLTNIFLGIAFIISVVFFGSNFVDSFINKGQGFREAQKTGTGYFSNWEFVLSIITIVIILLCLFIIHKKIKFGRVTDRGCISLYRFLLPLSLSEIVLMFVEFNIFQRLGYFLIMLIGPIIETILDDDIKTSRKSYYGVLMALGVFMLIIACLRGDLSALKFFE